jgi:hypothetical protein
MEKSSQTAWKIVPLRHFFPLKVAPLIEVLLYTQLQSNPVLQLRSHSVLLDQRNHIQVIRSISALNPQQVWDRLEPIHALKEVGRT